VRVVPEGESGALRFPVRAAGITGREAWAALSRLGVARSYPRALPTLPVLGDVSRASRNELPGSYALAAELITLPTHSWLPEDSKKVILRLLTDPA